MASRRDSEDGLFQVVSTGLSRWLERVRAAVMAPWRRHQLPPDPSTVYSLAPQWQDEVDTILTKIGQIAMAAWSEASDVAPVSRHAFIQAQLAQTENLLVRMPDEVYHLIFAEIADGVNAGNSVDQIADRIDQLLTWSGTYWPGRARTIAMTETTRARGAGTLAAGMEQSRLIGRLLRKRWDTERDANVRATHRTVGGEVRELDEPFNVGGFPLQFPADPVGPADEVCGCRCDLMIINER